MVMLGEAQLEALLSVGARNGQRGFKLVRLGQVGGRLEVTGRAALKGEAVPDGERAAAGLKQKAEVSKALKDSFAYCADGSDVFRCR